MNRELFLLKLEQLLYDIPKEERDEAMDYYRGYFEDAGEENEAVVIEELESPQAIADSIKEALRSTGDMAGGLKNPPQVRDGREQSYGQRQGYKSIFSGSDFQKSSGQQSQGTDTAGQSGGTGYQNASDSKGAAYRRYDQYGTGGSEGAAGAGGSRAFSSDRRSKWILFVILAVFTSPIWGAALSGVLGVAGVVIAAVVVLAVCSVGCAIGGIVCTIVAIVRLCTLAVVSGLLLLGTGMLLIAGGGISTVLLLLLCGKLLPWAFRQLSGLFDRILHWGRSAA
ncbi:MAG: DUF1700 domain-containing protein [Eubacterium sp.]|nr:DUF1700 domain-containing protein [Eubacterium sp.]